MECRAPPSPHHVTLNPANLKEPDMQGMGRDAWSIESIHAPFRQHRDGVGDLKGRLPAAPACRGPRARIAFGSSPICSRKAVMGLTCRTYTAHRPLFGTLERLRRVIAGGPRPRLQGPLSTSALAHLDQHDWFPSRSRRDAQPRPDCDVGLIPLPEARPHQMAQPFRRPGLEFDPGRGNTT